MVVSLAERINQINSFKMNQCDKQDVTQQQKNLQFFIMEKAGKNHPLYLGIFATDPKNATKIVKNVCKDSLLHTLKTLRPEAYCQQQQKLYPQQQKYQLQAQPNQHEVALIQKDFMNFEGFNCPKDNYHITCLFMGKNKDKLHKNDKQIMNNWKNGIKQPIKVDFIVYVPNYLMAGYTSSTGKVQVSNEFPHMTLLLKEKASAVESNAILAALNEKVPDIFQKREKKVTILEVPYLNISRIMVIIDVGFELQAVTGDNCTCGKK